MARNSSEVVAMPRLTSQSRNMIMNVLQYFRRQDELECETDVMTKTAVATGVSQRTVFRIKKQAKAGRIKSPPPRSRFSKVLGSIDEFGEERVRREILSFYERGEIPTLNILFAKVKKPPMSFPGCKTSLRNLLVKVGFRFKKVQRGRRMLMEKNDIMAARNKFLRELSENRKCENPLPEIYVDETWIYQNECGEKNWSVKESSVIPRWKTRKGAKFIIVHAGGEDGFVPGALFIKESKDCDKDDYQDSLNSECFRSWFQNQLLPNISHQSLIIMDNASYHSKLTNRAPSRNSKKCEVIEWLTHNNIDHDQSQTRSELLQLAALHKDKEMYEIDQIALENGHKVVRLPAYHCTFNPLELIWVKVKSEIKKQNSSDNPTLKEIEEMCMSVIKSVSKEDWRECISQSRDVEEEYRIKGKAAEQLIESFVDMLDESSSESDEYE
ncbi:uncharacterized protein LOC143038655 [Oratosquilla oratoria]|uniref:uncharacterized protein LOC143038655 n=1 Tax=Oratosquilla oratoria TaxID=337810 RepID=UPI003F76E68A